MAIDTAVPPALISARDMARHRGSSGTLPAFQTVAASDAQPFEMVDFKGQPNGFHDKEKVKDEAHLLPAPVSSASKSAARHSTLIDALWIVTNGVTTVAVVFLNKITFTDPQFRQCQISFAIWHFFATFLVLYFASLGPYAIFNSSRLPIRQVLPVCILFASFLVLNNLSLTHNNVGFYQLAKIMTTPSVVFFNYILFYRKVSRSKLLCVLLASGGVALANGVSAQSNPIGAIIAVLAFCATALYQIWIGKTLQDLSISAPQLLCNQTWISCILLIPFLPFFDSTPDFALLDRTAVISFISSGFVAALVNLSQFYIIGRTSALTFNIVSVAKTITVLIIGWFLEGKVFTISEVAGVAMALSGAFLYAQTPK